MTITRRDFVNGVMVGSGASLMFPEHLVAGPATTYETVGRDWYGYGGVGDYAPSHGNTPNVVNAAHRLRDGGYAKTLGDIPIQEEYDVVVVGGGMAGLGAAWHFKKHAKPGQTCLMLDNHPLFGGEAKENEFNVDGETLLAPQGANSFFLPPHVDDPEQASGDARYYAEFNIPRNLQYRQPPADEQPLNFSHDNYAHLYWLLENGVDVGHFIGHNGSTQFAKNIWQNKLANTPYTAAQRESFLAWRNSRHNNLQGNNADRLLDSMSYKEFLQTQFNLGAESATDADPFLAGAFGLGGDAISAWAAKSVTLPGTLSQQQFEQELPERHSFPGGNSGFARYFLKHILPDSITGKHEFADIIGGRINFSALDREKQSVRIRLNSTAVSVCHEGDADDADNVRVVYSRDGKEVAVRAKAVVMASGGWINRHVVKDMPDEIGEAYSQFNHAPFLVANVALRNWRFLYKLGVTACRWQEGFGNNCNIRQPMTTGRHQPSLHPDKPAVLTFYVPFHSPGLAASAQVTKGRAELFSTSYADYERQIIQQMNTLFSATGFNAGKDVSGLILNRWGHAFVVPEPGFFFDTPDRTAPRNTVQKGYGRIAFGHSELEGFQHWGPAADQGRRAMTQVLAL